MLVKSKMRIIKKILKYIGIGLAVFTIGFVIFYIGLIIVVRPSNNRDWSTDLAVLPYAEFNDNLVAVHNIRNFKYKEVWDYTPAYYDKTFDINKIKEIDFIVEPFSTLAAHTFVAFGFEDGQYVDISVEVRREKNEWFDAVKGLFRQFELTYVIADENDVLKLRTNVRKGDVYLYPIKTTKARMGAMFVDMLKRVNNLKSRPQFYNTFFSNCTTNIVMHVNHVMPGRIPFSFKFVFPTYSDELALQRGLIDDSGTIKEVRKRHLVTPIAQNYGNDPDFSLKIRQALKKLSENKINN